jgi:hypothetical protein
MKPNGSTPSWIITAEPGEAGKPQASCDHPCGGRNQVALGEPTPVPATLNRLVDEGLDRHEAIHAVGSILMNIVFDASHEPSVGVDINARYSQELASLTAAGWRSQVE